MRLTVNPGFMAVAGVLLALLAAGCGRPQGQVGVSVQIISEPPGAMVFIDNRYVGLTPYTAKDLSPCSHSLKVQKNGYKTYLASLDPQETGRQVEITLTSLATGKIALTSLPSDARVSLDGDYVGNTPITISDLAPHEYQVRVIADDYEPWLANVPVKDATPVQINAILTSRYEKYFQGAIAAEPDEIFNYTELAHHYLVRRDYDQAIEMYKKAVALSGGNRADSEATRRLVSELAKAYVGWFADTDEKDLDKLRPRIIALVSAHGDLNDFFRQVQSWDRQAKGQDFFRPGRPNTESIRLLEASIRENPKDVQLRLALGQLHLSERMYDKALETYQAIVKEDPKNYIAHRQLSDAYRHLGRFDDAQREMELAAECCDDPVWKPELHEKLAGSFQSKQRRTEAVEQWKKAIAASRDPEDACRRRLRLALLYQKMGEKEEALKQFREIVETTRSAGIRNYAQYFIKRAQR